MLSQQQPSNYTDTQNYQSLEQCKSEPQWEASSHLLPWLLAKQKDAKCCCEVRALWVADENGEPCSHFKRQPGSFQALNSELNCMTQWFDAWVFTRESWKYTSHKSHTEIVRRVRVCTDAAEDPAPTLAAHSHLQLQSQGTKQHFGLYGHQACTWYRYACRQKHPYNENYFQC